MKDQNKLILHILEKEDLTGIIKTFTFPWSSLQATQEKWERYYIEQQTNIRTVCIAKIGDEFIGYGSLLNNTNTRTSRLSVFQRSMTFGFQQNNGETWNAFQISRSEATVKMLTSIEFAFS